MIRLYPSLAVIIPHYPSLSVIIRLADFDGVGCGKGGGPMGIELGCSSTITHPFLQ